MGKSSIFLSLTGPARELFSVYKRLNARHIEFLRTSEHYGQDSTLCPAWAPNVSMGQGLHAPTLQHNGISVSKFSEVARTLHRG